MDLTPLFKSLRGQVSERVWDAGIRLNRGGQVEGRDHDDDEISLWLHSPNRSQPLEVYLYPKDEDWSCDCGFDGGCAHVVACVLAVRESQKDGKGLLPRAAADSQIHYRLSADAQGWLTLERQKNEAGGRKPLRGPLSKHRGLRATPADQVADEVLRLGATRLPHVGWMRMLKAFSDEGRTLELDGKQYPARPDPITPVLIVRDEGQGFKLSLHRSKRIVRKFQDGVVLSEDGLHPYSGGGLAPHERRQLAQGRVFSVNEAGKLVAELLPSFRERLEVKLKTTRLPDAERTPPRLQLRLVPSERQLQVELDLVYGEPAVARVVRDELQIISDGKVPLRDRNAERRLLRQAEKMRLPTARRIQLNEDEAIRFVRDRLADFPGTIEGDPRAFRVRREPVALSFDGERLQSEANLSTLMRAWEEGRTLVPLIDGGYAPIPVNLLQTHGELIADLVEAKGDAMDLPAHATFAAARLAKALDAPPPPKLDGLRPLIEDFDGLPPLRLPDGLNATLRPYQELGVRWLGFLTQAGLGGILADDMGLGKTLQALTAAATLLEDQGGQILVVAPTSLLHNWSREAVRFIPHLRPSIFHGPKRKLDEEADLVITSYALMRSDPAIKKRRWTLAILDEAQAIKNPESQTAQAAFKLKAAQRWSLTGTPIENRLDELWSQMHFCNPGLLGGRRRFDRTTARPIEGGDRSAAKRLRERIRPFVLRRHKSEVATDLPPRTDLVLPCPMTPAQRKVYEMVAIAGRQEVAEMMGSGQALQVLELLLRMRQAACHPQLLPGERPNESGKLEVLLEKVDEVVEQGSKALIFSQWTGFLDLIGQAMLERGLDFCRLDGSTRDRQGQVDRFQSPDGPPLFLISLKAGGTGLNLTAADYVFHTDPWWNPAVEDQATDRAHRIGQDKPVFSVKLVSEDSVEEGIVALQAQKRALAEAAIGSEAEWVEKIGRDDLLALFAE